MRILYVINGTEAGGAEMVLVHLAVGLRNRGHDTHVLSLKPLGALATAFRAGAVPLSSLDMAEDVTPLAFANGVRRLADFLRRDRWDVINSLLPRANVMSRIANRFARRLPHVSAEHSLGLRQSRFLRFLGRATVRWTDCVVAPSPPVQQRLIAGEHLPPGKVRMILNGIDIPAVDAVLPVDPAEYPGLVNGGPLLCSVGRLNAVKGYDYLLDAMVRVNAMYPHARLALVGDGPEGPRLADQIRRLGLTGKVMMLGYRRDPVAVIKVSDLFVLSSVEEAMPVAALEAMAARKAVVGTAVGGLKYAIERGQSGLLVPPRDIEALAAAMQRLLGDADLRNELAANGRRAVEAFFSVEEMLTATEALYREVTRAAP